ALAVTTSLKGVFYDHEAGNAETLFVCGKHPCLIPAATINPRHYHTRENLPGKLVQSGFRLLRLFPQVQNWSVHNAVLERILMECTQVQLCVAFPIGKLPDIASYLARIAPRGCPLLLSDVYYNSLTEVLEVMRRRPEFFMEVGHTCTPASLEYLCREIGADRLVLGSNLPLEYGRGTLEMIRRAAITERERAAILEENGSRLFGVG
ncbi:MAG: amidohydrolase, partial [Kiritimatiellae bacterium]|nr:amidohydrolase [Kiritimatiellia bacterium]